MNKQILGVVVTLITATQISWGCPKEIYTNPPLKLIPDSPTPTVFTKVLTQVFKEPLISKTAIHGAFLTRDQVNLGHTLVVPIEQISYFADLPVPLFIEMVQAAQKLGRAVQMATGAPELDFSIVGNEVAHVHFHLIPIFNAAQDYGRKPIQFAAQENETMVARIQSVLQNPHVQNPIIGSTQIPVIPRDAIIVTDLNGVVSFLPRRQRNLGHLILAPKSGAGSLNDLSMSSLTALFTEAHKLARAVHQATRCERVILEGTSVGGAFGVELIPVHDFKVDFKRPLLSPIRGQISQIKQQILNFVP